MAMLQRIVQFSSDTAAGFLRSSKQAIASNRFFNSAVAEAEKIRSSAFCRVRESQNDKATKAQTSDIFESRHGDLSRRWLGLGTARRFSGGPFRILADCGLQ